MSLEDAKKVTLINLTTTIWTNTTITTITTELTVSE